MNASEIIKSIEAEQLKAEVPEFRVGDTVKVYGKIKEGNRERIQVFEGVVIKRQGGSTPVLRSRPTGSIMMPGTKSCMFTHHLVHLLRQKDLVQVMHLFIGMSVVILKIRMFIYCTCRVHLETVHAIIHKIFQMLHPMLLAGKRLSHRFRQRILLRNAQIILDTEPKSHMIPHPM